MMCCYLRTNVLWSSPAVNGISRINYNHLPAEWFSHEFQSLLPRPIHDVQISATSSHPLTSILAPFSPLVTQPSHTQYRCQNPLLLNNGRNVLRILDGFRHPRSTHGTAGRHLYIRTWWGWYQTVAYTLSNSPNDVSGVLKPPVQGEPRLRGLLRPPINPIHIWAGVRVRAETREKNYALLHASILANFVRSLWHFWWTQRVYDSMAGGFMYTYFACTCMYMTQCVGILQQAESLLPPFAASALEWSMVDSMPVLVKRATMCWLWDSILTV